MPVCRMSEPGCKVKEAVQEGKVSQIRYQNYKVLYRELQERRKY